METRGQIALETIIILLILMMLFIGLVVSLQRMSMSSVQDLRQASLASQAVRNIANGVNLVGVGGYGAVKVMKIHMPQLNLPAGSTYYMQCGQEVGVPEKSVSMRFIFSGGDITPSASQLGLDYSQTPYMDSIKEYTDFTIKAGNDCDVPGLITELAEGKTMYFCFENLGEEGVDITIDDFPRCKNFQVLPLGPGVHVGCEEDPTGDDCIVP